MRAFLFLLAVLTLQNVHGAKILGLFSHIGKSHQMVFDPLLKTLAERGHEVTVVSFFPIKNPPENYTSVSLNGLSAEGLEILDLNYFDSSSNILNTLGIQKMLTLFNEFEPLASMALDVCSKIVDFQPLAKVLQKSYDVIIMEQFNSDCMLGLTHVYGLKAPIITLSSCSMMPWSSDRIGVTSNPSYVPVIRSSFTSKMSFLQRFENTVMSVYYKMWYKYNIQLKEKAIIEKRFGKMPDLQELSKNISAMMLNTFHSMNGARPLLPGVIEIGGIHLDHSRKPLPPVSRTYLTLCDNNILTNKHTRTMANDAA